MTSQIKFRLGVFRLAMLVMGLVILYATYQAFAVVRQLNAMRLMSDKVEADYVEIAEYLPKAVNELNSALFRYVTSNKPDDWRMFQATEKDFTRWLDEHKLSSTRAKVVNLIPLPMTVDVGGLLERIGRAYTAYLEAAHQASGPAGRPVEPGPMMAAMQEAQRRSGELYLLASHARGHGEAIRLFKFSSVWLPEVRPAAAVYW